MFPRTLSRAQQDCPAHLVTLDGYGPLSFAEGIAEPTALFGSSAMHKVCMVEYHPKLTLIVVGCDNGSLHVFDGDVWETCRGHDGSGECRCVTDFTRPVSRWFAWNPLCAYSGHVGHVTDCAFTEDGAQLFTVARSDSRLLAWDLKTPAFGRPKIIQQNCTNAIDLSGFISVTLVEGRKEVVAMREMHGLHSNTLVVVFNMDTGMNLRSYQAADTRYYHLTFGFATPTTPMLAVFTSIDATVLHVQRCLQSGMGDHGIQFRLRLDKSLELEEGYFTCAALSPNNTNFAVGTSLGSVFVYELSFDNDMDNQGGFNLLKIQTWQPHRRSDYRFHSAQTTDCGCFMGPAVGLCRMHSHRGPVDRVQFDFDDQRVTSFAYSSAMQRSVSQHSVTCKDASVCYDEFFDVRSGDNTGLTLDRGTSVHGDRLARKNRVFMVPNFELLLVEKQHEALAMGLMPRLGDRSIMRLLEPDLLRLLCTFVQ
jgi:WD40 repeat protein